MKTCKIINGKFSYILVVDGIEISFQGSQAAEYFESHFLSLGYDVVKEAKN